MLLSHSSWVLCFCSLVFFFFFPPLFSFGNFFFIEISLSSEILSSAMSEETFTEGQALSTMCHARHQISAFQSILLTGSEIREDLLISVQISKDYHMSMEKTEYRYLYFLNFNNLGFIFNISFYPIVILTNIKTPYSFKKYFWVFYLIINIPHIYRLPSIIIFTII